MWKGLNGRPKEWLRKCYPRISVSSRSASGLKNRVLAGGTFSGNDSDQTNASGADGRLTSSREPPHFYFGIKPQKAGFESHLVPIPTSNSEWKKFKRGQGSSCGFFDCIGYGYFVAAGLRLSRNGYFCSDERRKKKKKNDTGWNTFTDALLGIAFGRPRFLRHRFSVLPIGSTVQPSTSSSSANADESHQNVCTSYPLLEDHLNQLRELSDQYAAIALNSDALRLMEEKNWSLAIEYLTEASQLGLDKAMFNLGVCHECGQGVDRDLAKARECYHQAAELGHATARYNLAVFHLEGRGVPVNEKEGLKWMEMASNCGVKEAQTFWGLRCGQNGDYEKAVSLFQMAVDQKHADAEYLLGVCYENGLGVEMDVRKAACLYQQSADGGNVDACYALGNYYENGTGGLPQYSNAALDLYYKAAAGGHPLAVKMIESRLTDSDMKVSTTKPQGLRAVSSSPNLTQFRQDGDQTPKKENSSSLFDFTNLKEVLLGYWRFDSKFDSKDEARDIDDAKENCCLLSSETLNAKQLLA